MRAEACPLALTRYMEITKWCPPAPPSLERVPTGPCPSNRCFKISKWIFFTYSLIALQTDAFVLGLGASESACEPIKSRIAVPWSPLDCLDISPIVFQSHTFWVLVSPLQVSRLGVPNGGHKPSTPWREASDLWNSSHCRLPCWGWGFGEAASLSLLPSWLSSFTVSCEGTVLLGLF